MPHIRQQERRERTRARFARRGTFDPQSVMSTSLRQHVSRGTGSAGFTRMFDSLRFLMHAGATEIPSVTSLSSRA